VTSEVYAAIVAAIATVLVAWLALKGAGRTAAASKAASSEQAKVDAQESALQAWKDLLQPTIDEVERLRRDQKIQAEERAAKDAAEAKEREEKAAEIQQQILRLSERIDFLTMQLKHWKRLAKVIARWATTLRDQVLTLGGTVPATPEEMLLIQSLDDEDDRL